MKKIGLVFSCLFLSIMMFNLSVKADTNGSLLTNYQSDSLVTYYNSQYPVYLPKEMSYNKQDFRAAWVCTIWNLDVPKHTSEEQYKEVLTKMLDTLVEYNMNVLIYQVRPKNDAMYPSELNPWSRFMTGKEGVDPGWDPLAWLVEETHKRGIEFHAWFNPYRVFVNDLSPDNFASKHPDYVIKPGNESNDEILNPGIPEVQQFIVDSVMEVVNNYDIDGVHFDDYFYPYGGLKTTLDATQFQLYNENGLSLADWRRENVNHVIKGIKDQLTIVNNQQDRAVQLGMSPFGIWANKASNPLGSNTSGGVESYSELYADSRRWVKEGWIDYIVPQLYFRMNEGTAGYADLVDWWSSVVKDTNVNLYIGQAIYRYKEAGWNSPAWPDPNELVNQFLYNSKFDEVKGTVQFRYQYLKSSSPTNLTYAQNELKTNLFKYKVLPPASKNVDSTILDAPTNLTIQTSNQGNQLTWNKDSQAKAYYVYRYSEGELATLHEIEKVLEIIYPIDSTTLTYLDETATVGTTYRYFVTPFNKAYNEGNAAGINTSGESIQPDDDFIVDIMDNILKTKEQIETCQLLLERIEDVTSSVPELMTLLNTIYDNVTLLNDKISAFPEANLITEKEDALNQAILDLDALLLNPNTAVAVIDSKYETIKSIQTELNSVITEFESKYNEINTLKETIANDIDSFTSEYSTTISTTVRNQNTVTAKTFLNRFKAWITIINSDKATLDSQYQTTIDEINALNVLVTPNESKIAEVDESIVYAKNNVSSLINLAKELQTKEDSAESSFNTFDITYDDLNLDLTKTDYETKVTQRKTKVDEFKANIDDNDDDDDDGDGDVVDNPDEKPVIDDEKGSNSSPKLIFIIGGITAVIAVSGAVVFFIKRRM